MHCQFRLKAYLVRVAADGSDAVDSEVKWLNREACGLKEGHNEAAEAAINMETDVVLLRELAQRDDIVLAAIREVNRGPYNLCGVKS